MKSSDGMLGYYDKFIEIHSDFWYNWAFKRDIQLAMLLRLEVNRLREGW